MTTPDGGPEAPVPPPGGAGQDGGSHVKRTTYRSGHVPGVSYRGGRPHSPDDDDATPIPQPAAAAPGGTSVMASSQEPAQEPAGAAPPPPGRRGRTRDDDPPPRPKKRRSGFGRFLRWLLIIILIIAVVLAALLWYVWGRIDKVDAIPDDHGDARSDGRVFLIVGSDSREDLSEDEQSDLGTGDASGQRTDTIMLLHVPGGGRPALVSVPRDSVVDIPGEGENRVNASFAFGGASLLVETLEANTGVAIDDYVQIGFGGFADIVDALGGVEMCLDEAIEDEKANIDLPAGCQELGGTDALGYARARYFDPRADLGRVERQRELISAISDKALSAGTILNPLELTRTALAGGDALVLDEDTGPLDMLSFVRGIGAVSGDSGDTLTVPLGDVGNTVTWDEEQADLLWTALRDGTDIPPELLEQE